MGPGDGSQGGNSNRDRYLQGLKADSEKVYYCKQVHSRKVVVLRGSGAYDTSRLEADGLVTDRPDVLLTVTVADCLPIFLVDHGRGAFGLLHSGWRGTGIAVEGVKSLEREFGSRASDLTVVIGPGIGSCCYRVDAGRYRDFRRRFGPESVRRRRKELFLDLREANVALLRRLGIGEVLVCLDCTVCSPQLASYRRDGPGCIHMLASIGVPDNE